MPVREAVAIATATPDGRPSVRMVLMKGADERRLRLPHRVRQPQGAASWTANPRAALLFHWSPLGRQVRVEGAVERDVAARVGAVLPDARAAEPALGGGVAAERGRRRPRRSWSGASRQRCAEYGDDPPLPERWGGFRLRPRCGSSGSTARTGSTTGSATGSRRGVGPGPSSVSGASVSGRHQSRSRKNPREHAALGVVAPPHLLQLVEPLAERAPRHLAASRRGSG